MLTRRDVLRLAARIGACASIGLVPITQKMFTGIGHAQEPDRSVEGLTMEAWMNEWMSMSRAVGGMLRLSRFREPIYFLTDPISWTPNAGQQTYQGVTVPTGFVTDLASIPRVFYSWLRPDGEYAYAAIVHDYLYWMQTGSREEADHILKIAMEDFGIDALTVGTIYGAVRAGGQAAWSGNTKKKTQGEKRILTRFPQDPRTKWDDWKQRPGVFAP